MAMVGTFDSDWRTRFSGSNLLINLTNMTEVSENFEQSQKLLFSGPFVIQIVGIGMIIPICEELIYRGLIFMRMRQYCNVNLAIGLSALLFAAFHAMSFREFMALQPVSYLHMCMRNMVH